MAWARTTQRLLTALIAAAIVAQVFLAGAGAFGATSYAAHRALGWSLVVGGAVELVVALLAMRLVRRSSILFLLLALQAALGSLGANTEAWLGAFHAVNALAVMAAAGMLARQARLAR